MPIKNFYQLLATKQHSMENQFCFYCFGWRKKNYEIYERFFLTFEAWKMKNADKRSRLRNIRSLWLKKQILLTLTNSDVRSGSASTQTKSGLIYTQVLFEQNQLKY